MTLNFINSQEYQNEMNKFLVDNKFDLNEAEAYSENYKHRHFTCKKKLQIWRWRGMYQYKDYILNIIQNKDIIVDFGGAACPLGLNSVVVDFLKEDLYGNKVKYNNLNDIKSQIDVIFSSHCLEHIEDIPQILKTFQSKMKENGNLLIFVPAWTCKRWRYGTHKHSRYNDHKWTIALSNDNSSELKNIKKLLYIDTLISNFFNIKICEYCGDNSIFIHCTSN